MQIVRCNMCYWSGPETNIPVTSEDKEYCPRCGSVGCLMDIDNENTAEYKTADGRSLSQYMIRANNQVYDYECVYAENDNEAIKFCTEWAEEQGFKITGIYKTIWEG